MPKKDIIIKDGLIVNAGTNTKKLHVDPITGNVIISGSLDVSGDVVVQGTIASGSEAEFGMSATNPNLQLPIILLTILLLPLPLLLKM